MRNSIIGLLGAMLLVTFACSSPNVSRSLGAQCSTRDDCEERCERGGDYPDGICTVACERDRDCPSSARCVDKEGGICLFDCGSDPDCEFLGAGWRCNGVDSFENTEEEVLVCIGE